jgi:transposase
MATIPKPVVPACDWRENDPLLTPQQVAERLNTSLDWVWDHSSRKTPLLPVIRFGDGPGRAGMLRYRASKIEEFILEQERFTNTRRRKSGCRMAQPTCSPTEIEERNG